MYYLHTSYGSSVDVRKRTAKSAIKEAKTFSFPIQVSLQDGDDFRLVYAHVPPGTEEQIKYTSMSSSMIKHGIKANEMPK